MPMSKRTRDALETGVYCWLNKANGKMYVGSTGRSFHVRMRAHLERLRAGKHHSRHLQAAWDKYGEDNFDWVILWRCLPSECIEWEDWWIDRLQTSDRSRGYNVCPKASSHLGLRWTDEAKAKHSIAQTITSRATAAQRSVSQKKTMADPEVKAKHRAATVAAMSDPELRRKASDGAKKQWEEGRDKMVAIQRNKWTDPEIRVRMLAGNKSKRKLSDEQMIEIRQRYGTGCDMKALAKEYIVSKTTIFHVVHNTYQRKGAGDVS